jgi:hypothetical protein
VTNGWTPERRAKQRAAIHRWRPWEKSTGPKTKDGKRTAARNALKHGHRSAEARRELEMFRRLIDEAN